MLDNMSHENTLHAPGVRHFLDASTQHLTAATREALLAQELGACEAYFVAATADGFLLYVLRVSDNPEAWRALPRDMRALFQHAASVGCAYVLLDRDAATLEALPVYPED